MVFECSCSTWLHEKLEFRNTWRMAQDRDRWENGWKIITPIIGLAILNRKKAATNTFDWLMHVCARRADTYSSMPLQNLWCVCVCLCVAGGQVKENHRFLYFIVVSSTFDSVVGFAISRSEMKIPTKNLGTKPKCHASSSKIALTNLTHFENVIINIYLIVVRCVFVSVAL